MKKIYLAVIAILSIIPFVSNAQNSNPWPTSGNVGIGTTVPANNIGFLNVDADAGNSGITWYNVAPLNYGIYKTTGAWTAPDYQQIKIAWDTGILLYPGSGHSKSYVEIGGGGLRVTSGNVGIGTTNPTAKLDVLGVVKYGNGNTSSGALSYGPTGLVTLEASSPNTSIALLTSGTGNVGIGTVSPDEKLTVYGKIHSKEVKVDLSVPGPDYVFEPDYQLKSLTKLKTYVDKNHHLPEIPSATEMAKNGIDLGDMNIKLLKKVEELTLYLIEQNKQLTNQQELTKAQQEEINQLKQQQKTNQSLQEQINQLAKQLTTKN